MIKFPNHLQLRLRSLFLLSAFLTAVFQFQFARAESCRQLYTGNRAEAGFSRNDNALNRAVSAYHDYGDRINYYLITGNKLAYRLHSKEEFDAIIADLDKAISRFQLDESAILFRGVSTKEFPNEKIPEVGDTFISKAFKSTSYSQLVAMGFAEDKFSSSSEVILVRIHTAPSQHAMEVNRHSVAKGFRNEKEILLPRNLKFIVTGKHFDSESSVWTIDITIQNTPFSRVQNESTLKVFVNNQI